MDSALRELTARTTSHIPDRDVGGRKYGTGKRMRAASGLAGALRGTLVVGVPLCRGGDVGLLFAG
jgi:hypothetical protein